MGLVLLGNWLEIFDITGGRKWSLIGTANDVSKAVLYGLSKPGRQSLYKAMSTDHNAHFYWEYFVKI